MITSQDWGGAQLYVFELAKELKARGEKVIVVAGHDYPKSNNEHQKLAKVLAIDERGNPNHIEDVKDKKQDEQYKMLDVGRELSTKCLLSEIDFVELKHMTRDINPITNIKAVFELIKLFRELEPKVIHLNSTMMGVIGSLAGKLAHIPKIVYCIGGWVFNEDLPNWKKKLYIWIEKLSAKWKDVIITVHPEDENLAKRLGIKPKGKMLTIPNGIDVKQFESELLSKEMARERLGIHPEAIIVGTIANAYPPKNLLWYLEVCKKINEADRRICFVIVGDGPQFEALQRMRDSMNAQNYIMLTGRRMDAPTLYRAFDVFVLPSSKEGMSITLLEAMASKIPIIATDVGATKWMLAPKAGLIVPPKNLKALGNAILDLIKDPILGAQLADQAYEVVKERFQKHKTMQESVDVLI